jgi:universal stress protein E
MRPHSILVALPCAGRIGPIEIGKIATLAGALEAEVELFRCLYEAGMARPAPFAARAAQLTLSELAQRRRQELEVLAGGIRATGVRVRTSVRWDHPPYAGIVRQVLRHQPILLIAHPSRRGHAARRLLGRTDFRLIETCPCPVLFIKTLRPYADSLVLAAVDPRHAHDKPAALDSAILDWARRLCDSLSARLALFHAHAPLEQDAQLQRELREAPEAVRADVATAWRSSLEAGAQALAREYDVPDQRVRVGEGPAAQTLIRFAGDLLADIVVIGAAERSRLSMLLAGHTAEKVLDALDSDVLIVKAPGFRSPVSPQSTHHVRRSAAPAGRMIWR